MRLSFATALLAAVAVSPLCAAAPMEVNPDPQSSAEAVIAAADALSAATDAVVAAVTAPVVAAAAAPVVAAAAAAAADGPPPSWIRRIPGHFKSGWNSASGAVRNRWNSAAGAVKTRLTSATGAVKTGWNSATGAVKTGLTSATHAVKTGARKSKDLATNPRFVAGAALGSALYAGYRFGPAVVKRLRQPEPVTVHRCTVRFSKDADCPPAYEGSDNADAVPRADDKVFEASDADAKAALEAALGNGKVSGTITTTRVVSPVGVQVRISE